MPIPFILGGIALVAAGYGVKKGLDAKEDFDDAKDINDDARLIFDAAKLALEKTHAKTKQEVLHLGEAKFHAYELLTEFVPVFSKIKNVNFDGAKNKEYFHSLNLTSSDLTDLKNTVLEIKSTIGAGIASLGAGGLAGLAAYGAVGTFAAASTGTAIASLGGVAATNATLAWLGGGSLATGGFGMAGGMAVLGGVVAGPVLAVGGAILAAKAEEAKHNAYANFAKAKLEVEGMKKANLLTRAIGEQFCEVKEILLRLQMIFSRLVEALTYLVSTNTDFRTYSESQKQLVMLSFATAKTLKNLLETQILSDEGNLLDISIPLHESQEYVANTDRLLHNTSQ